MPSEPENSTSWLDDIMDLIRRKQEESKALRKVQESLQSIGKAKDIALEPLADENKPNDKMNKDQSVINKENNEH